MTRVVAAARARRADDLAAACSDRATAQKPPPPPPAVPVSVADAVQRTVPLQVSAVGNVQAYTTCLGEVAGGRRDPRSPLHRRPRRQARRPALHDRSAALRDGAAPGGGGARPAPGRSQRRRARTSRATSRSRSGRRCRRGGTRELLSKELIAREQYEQIRTNAAAMDATVRAVRAAEENARAAATAAQAAVDNARLQLSYTKIHAPIDGRTGNLLVQRGNVIKANEDNPLVVIAQVRADLRLVRACPSSSSAPIRRYQAAGRAQGRGARAGPAASVTGTLTFLNNTVDPTTGTIQLKATFANGENAAVAGSVRGDDAHARERGRGGRAVAGDPGGPAGPVRVRREARSHAWSRGRSRPAGASSARRSSRAASSAGERVVTDGQLRLAARRARSTSRRRPPRRREARALHPPPRPHDAAHGGRSCSSGSWRTSAPAGERPAERRLPDDPGHREPPGREPGDDGVRRGHAARAAVQRRSRASTR